MNRAARLAVGLLVCGWVVGGAAAQDFSGQQPEAPGPASGSSIPSLPSAKTNGAGLPVGMKNAADATGFADQIGAFVDQQVGKIASNNADDQRTARTLLITECNAESTTSFLDVYAQAVNSSALAALSKNPLPPLRVRLNLAVMVEAVAHTTRDASLKPTVSKLVADPGDPIALWGVRAARALLVPAALQNPLAPDPLLALVVQSVKDHAKFGFLAEEAYRTLSLEGEGVTLATVPNTLTSCTQAMLDVMNFRIAIYTRAIADDPEAEDVAARFFSASYDKGLATAEQRGIVQALTNLVTVIGAQTIGATRPVLEQMVGCLKLAAQSLTVITKEPPGTPLERVQRLVAGTGGTSITQATGGVYGELKANPSFAYLAAPPMVTPTSRPTTQRHSSSTTPPPPAAAAAAVG
jgi:hypothetical protein